MRKNQSLKSYLILFIPFVIFNIFSCTSAKNIRYFKNVPDSGFMKSVEMAQFKEPVIKPDDILNISFQTIDPAVTVLLNQAPSPSSSSSSSKSVPEYLVNKDGFIDLPIIGKLKIVDLTSREAAALIQEKAAVFFKSPTVQVRFANYKISVLGEVNKPAIYTVPNEKVTVMDAISLAGDLTIYGKRTNVLIVRDVDGKKEFARVDLTSTDLFKSPYFYLQPNDLVYVEPGKGHIAANNAGTVQLVTIAISALSLLAILLTRIK